MNSLLSRRKALIGLAAPALLLPSRRIVRAASSVPVTSSVAVQSGSGLFNIKADYENIPAGTPYDGPTQYAAYYNSSALTSVRNGGYTNNPTCSTTVANPTGECTRPTNWAFSIQAKGKGGGNCLQMFFPQGSTMNSLIPSGYGFQPGVTQTFWSGSNNASADIINLSFDWQWAPGFGFNPSSSCDTSGSKMGPQCGFTWGPNQYNGILATWAGHSSGNLGVAIACSPA